jgi:metal-responsive CopG/Arc/MetJ family transcriptional regulator
MHGKKNSVAKASKKKVLANCNKPHIQEIILDAMRQYLQKHDWLQGNDQLNSFNIIKLKEHFSKTEDLDFEEAIDAVRIYEKINFI